MKAERDLKNLSSGGVTAPFIAVDWGTSQMRAMLVNAVEPSHAAGQPRVPTVRGRGIGKLKGTPADELFEAVASWASDLPGVPLLLGGMAGSNMGLREAAYVPTPVAPVELVQHVLAFELHGHPISIVPGLSGRNSLGLPDTMRGEEVQILGWIEELSTEALPSRLLCLPGTHTKWALVEEGRVGTFTTSLTGELYDLLALQSVLVPPGQRNVGQWDSAAFERGVVLARDNAEHLPHLLFSARARKLIPDHDYGDAASYLSGLLIGADVHAALRSFDAEALPIEIIGSSLLCERFALTLEIFGYGSVCHEGDAAALAGFKFIAGSLAL